MRAVVAIGAAALVALGLAGASGAKLSHAESAVRVGPNLRATGGVRPAALGWASYNWSGYAVTSDAPYSGVVGNWTVPTVTGCSAHGRHGTCYSGAWVGIDGFVQGSQSLIQTGTEQDYTNKKGGRASYSAWWTTSSLGYIEQTITVTRPHGHSGKGGSDPCTTDVAQNCGTVAPGDAIHADISNSSGQNWVITLTDSTQGWTFQTTVTYTGPGASAEWIMEAPTVGGQIATLPTYSTFAFDPGTVNGSGNPGLQPSDGGPMILSDNTTVVSIPSAPDSDTDGFNIAYGSTPPSPPGT